MKTMCTLGLSHDWLKFCLLLFELLEDNQPHPFWLRKYSEEKYFQIFHILFSVLFGSWQRCYTYMQRTS